MSILFILIDFKLFFALSFLTIFETFLHFLL